MSLNINQNHSGVGDNIINKKNIQEKSKKWFSMDNPIIYLVVLIIISILTYLVYK